MADGVESVGQLRNVSRFGVFVRSEDLPRPGAAVAVQFRTPDGRLVDARGEVRWNTHGLTHATHPGFGVQIHEPPREFLEFFLWALAQAKEEKPADDEVV
jgi:hypothetical protein